MRKNLSIIMWFAILKTSKIPINEHQNHLWCNQAHIPSLGVTHNLCQDCHADPAMLFGFAEQNADFPHAQVLPGAT